MDREKDRKRSSGKYKTGRQAIGVMFFLCCFTVVSAQNINVIPQPKEYAAKPGQFALGGEVMFYINSKELKSVAQYVVAEMKTVSGLQLSLTDKEEKTSDKRTISLEISPSFRTEDEGYRLDCSPEKVSVKAVTPQGIFYGVQTLLQLISSGEKPHIPCMSVKDEPRFSWRGLMLDVSRHFFTVDEVKRLIDQMAVYKFNILHLHLTDDQGWRLEIKSLPALTQVGAWRVPRTGLWWEREPPKEGEKATYGGFYTQEQMEELIGYAASKHIEILPEINVPGHCLAAIAAYPNLSCTKEKYHVNPGSIFYGEDDNALCVGQEATFDFLEKVFTEVACLFPFDYIHIGGDECFKGFWEKCDSCRKQMAENGLANTDELQSYFIKRLEKILQENNKKLIGWDEIMEGGLAPDATVMSWRGMTGGINAAKGGHHVVMSPNQFAYLDFYQGDPAVEPPTYQMLRLKNVYSFNPMPDGVEPSLILGGQGNLWAESVPTFRHAEYMYWPRSLALSEVLWSPEETKDWDNFIRRTEHHLKKFDQADINYARSFYDAIITPSLNAEGELEIRLDTEICNLEMYYTFNNTYPDHHNNRYRDGEKLTLPPDADTFRVITYKDGKPIGRMITVSIKELKERTKTSWIN